MKNKSNLRVLREGVYDQSIFKAIFLAGGPGAGKSTAVSKVVFPNRYGLKNVNVDTLFEMFLQKKGASMDMNVGSSEERSDRMRAFNRARALTRRRQDSFVDGRLGLVIDGTGGSYGVIAKQKKQLEDLGYDTFMVFVDTTLDTAIDRNIKRGEKGGRRLRDKDLVRSWSAVNKNKEPYIKLFGQNIVIVDGNDFEEKSLAAQEKIIRKFLIEKPKKPEAKAWIANELQRKKTKSGMSEMFLRKYIRELLRENDSRSLELAATLHHLSLEGAGHILGTVVAKDTKNGLLFIVNVTGLTPGEHGLHIHENPDLGPGLKDGIMKVGLAAGGHFDPMQTKKHLGPYGNGHLGDLPKVYADSDGTVKAQVLAPRIKALDVAGRPIIIHSSGDNYFYEPDEMGGGKERVIGGILGIV